jgi:hypothetical protein
VLAGVQRALGIPMATLLHLSGAAPAASVHTLLVQASEGRRPVVPAAARAAGATIAAWIEIRHADRPEDAVRTAAAEIGARTARPVGVAFASSGSRLRADAAAVLAAERTWEADVAAACRDAAGAEPAANVCVYRAADLAAAGADPLNVALDLMRAHPRVAMQDTRGRVSTGPAAIQAILGLVRPASVSPGTWASLAAAAAAGLHRETAAA